MGDGVSGVGETQTPTKLAILGLCLHRRPGIKRQKCSTYVRSPVFKPEEVGFGVLRRGIGCGRRGGHWQK